MVSKNKCLAGRSNRRKLVRRLKNKYEGKLDVLINCCYMLVKERAVSRKGECRVSALVLKLGEAVEKQLVIQNKVGGYSGVKSCMEDFIKTENEFNVIKRDNSGGSRKGGEFRQEDVMDEQSIEVSGGVDESDELGNLILETDGDDDSKNTCGMGKVVG